MRNSNKEDWSNLLPDDPQGADALWDMSAGFGESPEVDVSKAWAQFEQRLEVQQTPKQPAARRINWKRYATAAAAAILFLVTINFFSGSTTVTEYANVDSTESTLILEDQTEVSLAQGASIKVRMEEDVRLVELLGKATFNVTSNAGRPFKISTPELDVVVLGTSFTVQSGQHAKVSVVEGHVRVRGRNEADWTDLFAGDAVDIRQSLVVSSVSDTPVPGVPLRFDDAKLQLVVESVEAAHDIQFVIPSKLSNCSITADFSGNTAMEIASTLAVLFNAEMSVDGQTVKYKGGRCQ